MSARNVKLNIILAVALVLGLLFAAAPGSVMAASIVYVDNLQPDWTAPGGGGVFSAYIAPPAYGYVSPGSISVFNGREAGVIKAGITPKSDGHYDDEGLFGFKPNMTINTFAAGPVSYDVINETGSNPVWMTIEIDTNVAGDRTDNTTYQYVPTTNPVEWHTVDATTGLWQMWNDNNGSVGTNPLITLAEVASAHSGLDVVRAYLRLGMGDSYHGTGDGTIGWVDKVNLGGITYDFVLPQYWYVSPEGLDTNEGTLASPFLTIQKAITSAASGDTINVAAGEYITPTQVVINKNLSIVGADKATTIVKPGFNTGSAGDARGWFLVNSGVTFNLSNVTLDGAGWNIHTGIRSNGSGTISDNLFKNIVHPGYEGRAIQFLDDMTIAGNVFENIGRIGIFAFGSNVDSSVISGNTYTGKGAVNALDYGIEVGGGAIVTITENTITNNRAVATTDGSTSAGILVTTYFDAGTSATITKNTLSGNSAAIAVGYDASDTSTVVAQFNQLGGNDQGIVSTNPVVDATKNWWGSIAGPAADYVDDTVDFTPWCATAACDTFFPDADQNIIIPGETDPQVIQDLIHNAPEYSNVLIPPGSYDKVGGFVIDTPHLTILVGRNAHINNHSSCFDIQASYTTIEAEVSGESFCTPDGADHGFAVDAGLRDVIIKGFDIDGSQTTGNAINFAGDITNLQIVENKIHDFAGSGIVFSGAITNNQGIQGNLFKNITAVEIDSDVQVVAQFNNWDSKTAVTIPNVDTSNWTYAGLKVSSSGTPWANQVVSGQTITYTVKADLVNVTSADFTLAYPDNLTLVASTPIVMGGTFTSESVDTSVPGKLTFIGVNLSPATPETGDDLVLFSATFTAGATGSGALTFDPATDGFGMVPTTAVAPSNMVYTNALNNGTVNVITLPTLSWVDAFPTYAAGFPQAFTLTITNGTGGTFTPTVSFVGSGFTVTGDTTVGTLTSGGVSVLNLTISFAAAGPQSVTVNLIDPAATPSSTVIATINHAVVVNANYSVTGTISMQGRTFRGDVLVWLNNLGLQPYGPFEGTTTAVFTNNLVITNVAMETYLFTTVQPRYLDVIPANNKQIFVNGNKTLSALELKGGDVNDDDEIGGGDASMIGTAYGETDILDADANYNGKVDIFDLALVGGNYLLTSETAYGIGNNIWVP